MKTIRMIDADALCSRLVLARGKTKDEGLRKVLATMIYEASIEPTVEKAVVPVRCEECRDYKGGYCVGFGPEGYCSDGRPDIGRGRRRC